ncbi:sensor histidine kinase [Paludifilum halophilum]|uniref:histidine kinase n=1 Tax=Paludifilum halophilum TaxID=1642702 RepID=A0A235B1D5_9BACL|nr:HAMP domain-containing sensor histidine kinase [Paludifilum halophilum]OYD06093.1 two-component sensor histidine kinase [Paludifilum halophilum]
MRIKTKIQLFSTVWMCLILLLINTGIYYLFHHISMGEEVDRLKNKTESIIKAVHAETAARRGRAKLLKAYIPDEGMIRVVDSRSQPLLTVTEEPELVETIRPRFKHGQHVAIYREGEEDYATAYFPMLWENGDIVTLEVTESLQSVQRDMEILRMVLAVATLAVLLPSILGGRMLSRLILRPIHSLTRTMEENQRGSTFKKLDMEYRSKDELYQMAATFNRMMDLMKANFEKQRQFISDASHELKTPLTIIESYAQLLKRRGKNEPEILEEAVEEIHSESRRMKEMTRQMLVLARGESLGSVELQEVDLTDLCGNAVKPLIQTFHREIRVHSSEEKVHTLADPRQIKQLLFILLDNAIKYSKKPVEVWVGYDHGLPSFSVTDWGAGIPREDIDLVFERFYRVDKARSRETGGTGLGLSIAREIVHAHNGKIDIDSEEGRGTTVTVSLPGNE